MQKEVQQILVVMAVKMPLISACAMMESALIEVIIVTM